MAGMDKLFLGFLIGIILSFGLMWLFIFQFITFTTIQVIETPEDTIMSKIERIALNVSSSQEYKVNKYDCTEFSLELVKRLKDINVSAYCIFGVLKGDYEIGSKTLHNPLHSWVGVDINNETYFIEATGGYIVADDELEKYKVVKKGVCL